MTTRLDRIRQKYRLLCEAARPDTPAFDYSPAFKRNLIPFAHSILYEAHEAFLAERWPASIRLYGRAIALFEQKGLDISKLEEMLGKARAEQKYPRRAR